MCLREAKIVISCLLEKKNLLDEVDSKLLSISYWERVFLKPKSKLSQKCNNNFLCLVKKTSPGPTRGTACWQFPATTLPHNLGGRPHPLTQPSTWSCKPTWKAKGKSLTTRKLKKIDNVKHGNLKSKKRIIADKWLNVEGRILWSWASPRWATALLIRAERRLVD